MMGFVCVFFVLSLTISTVGGLSCYSCAAKPLSSKDCLEKVDCASNMDHCYSQKSDGYATKGCLSSALCLTGATQGCCSSDLCNNAKNIGSSFILLLLSTAALYFL
ncbi:unnamed protein product [Boreogadus saida]